MSTAAAMDTAALIAELLPDGVASSSADARDWCGELFPEEHRCIAGASEKRRREFTAGRVCARRALEQLGICDFPLLSRNDRSPAWPPDVVGGISHSGDCCVSAVARRGVAAGIGIDVEGAEPLDAKLAAIIGTRTELECARRAAPSAACEVGKLLFSAKEAFFKCYYPLTQTWLDFGDVEIRFDFDTRAFQARLTRSDLPALLGRREAEGRFAATERFVFTSVCVARRR